jgi:hypothetical protein
VKKEKTGTALFFTEFTWGLAKFISCSKQFTHCYLIAWIFGGFVARIITTQKEIPRTSSLFQTNCFLQLPHAVALFCSVEEQKDVRFIDMPVSTIALQFGHFTISLDRLLTCLIYCLNEVFKRFFNQTTQGFQIQPAQVYDLKILK